MKTIKELKMIEIYPKRSIKSFKEKGYKQALKDVLGLIDEYEDSIDGNVIEELKKRINGT